MRDPRPLDLHFTQFEPRQLLAVIAFDGGPDGLGTDWTTAANWAGDVLPGVNDDAVLDGVGAVSINENVSVRTVAGSRGLVLSAGTLTIAQASNLAGRFTMNGGKLGGAGALTLAGGFDWTGGIIRTGGATGRITIPAGATMQVSGSDPKLLARGILNSGLVTMTNALVIVDDENGAAVNVLISNLATGTVRFTGESYFDSTMLGTRSLNNAGVIEKTGNGQAGVGFALNTAATGRVDILSGTFGLGLGTLSGLVNVADGAVLAISGHTLANGSRIVGSGSARTAEVGGATVTGTATIAGRLFLSRIDIFGSGTLRIEGEVQSDGSILACTQVSVVAGGSLLLQGGNGSNILSTRLTNAGMLRFGQSNIQVETLAGQFIRNSVGAVMTFEGTILSLFNDLNPGSLALENSGEVRVLSGGGTIGTRINLTNMAGATMNVQGPLGLDGVFVNAGTVNLTVAASRLTPIGVWSSTGSINVAAGLFEVRGACSVATLNTIIASGGEVRLRATIDLLGGTLSIAPGGVWTLKGGVLSNGTVVPAPGTPLLVGSFDGFTVTSGLRSITVNGDLALSEPTTILNWFNTLVTGTTTVGGNNATINFDGTQTVTGGTFVFPTTQGLHSLRVRSGQTVTIMPGVVLQGRFSIDPEGTNPAPTLVNRGIVRSNGGGGNQVNIGNLVFRNEGRLEAIASVISVQNLQGDAGVLEVSGDLGRISLTGTFTHSTTTTVGVGSTLAFAGTWSNTGQVNVSGGRWSLGGTFTRAGLGVFSRTAPGTIDLIGTLDNTGAVLALNAATGSINLVGGRILGGTVTQADGATIVISNSSQNRLSDVRIEGNLDLAVQGAAVRWLNTVVTGTVTITGQGATLGFVGTQTVASGTFIVSGSNMFNPRTIGIVGSGTVTLAPSVVVQGGGGFVLGGGAFETGPTRVLINQGSLLFTTANGNGQSPAIGSTTFTNQGSVEAVGYTVQYQGTISNVATGTLTGGTWIARGTGGVLPLSASVRNINAAVVIDGAGAVAGTMSQLTTVSGTLSILGGKVISTTPVGGTFQSAAQLTIGAGSRLAVTGAIVLGQSASGPAGTLRVGVDSPLNAGRLTATGTVTLGGALEITLGNVPVIGTRLSIVTGTAILGNFTSTIIPAPTLGIRAAVEFGAAAVVVYFGQAADYDNNAILSPDDLATFITDFYDPERRHLADYNRDGVVDDRDLGDFINAYFDR